MKTGSKAPAFSLLDQTGKTHKLADSLGKWVLIYFYPKDDTPGCTVEACTIRDNWPAFKKLKIQVYGVSGDTVAKHEKFASKFELPFTLLSDPERKMIDKYGALQEKSLYGRTYIGIQRMSVLVNPEGKIAKIYPKVKPADHAQEVLNDLKELV